jgi:hypothetical protein
MLKDEPVSTKKRREEMLSETKNSLPPAAHRRG